jgi:hypothetical protein
VWQRQAIRHGGSFLKHIVPAIVKPMHALWNEVVGFFFLSFAVIFGFKSAPYVRTYLHAAHASPKEFFQVALSVFVTVMMACFGISSFLRARRISRS